MNTQAHIVLSSVILGRGNGKSHWLAATLGALTPDLPMVVFYLYQRSWLERSENEIWRTLYFDPGWQQFFDVFNGLPLIGLGLLFAYAKRSAPATVYFLSMSIHAASDFLVHREDAHGHFFPISDWRFISPVSYWDPAYYGHYFVLFEFIGVLVSMGFLYQRGGAWRYLGITCALTYPAIAVLAYLSGVGSY